MAVEKREKVRLQHSNIFVIIGLIFAKLIVFLVNKISRLALSQPCKQNELVAWLNENLPGEDVNLHQEEALWRDGSLLCSLVNSVVPEACLNPHCHFGCPPDHGQALAYKYLGIKPVFDEHDFNQPTLSQEQNIKFKKYLKKVQKSISHFTESVRNLKYCTDYVAKGMGLVACEQSRKTTFFLYPVSKKYPSHDVEISIKGPYSTSGHITVPSINHKNMVNYKRPLYLSGKTSNISPTLQGSRFLRNLTKNYGGNLEDDIYIRIKITKFHTKVTYIPKNCGIHEIILTTNGYHLIGSPFSVIVDPPSNRYFSDDSLSEEEDKFIHEKRKYVPSIVDVKGEKMFLQENGTLEKITKEDKTNIKKQIDDNSNDHEVENKNLNINNEIPNDNDLISFKNNDEIEKEWNEIFQYNVSTESLYISNYFEDKFEEILRDNCTDISDSEISSNDIGNDYKNLTNIINKEITNTSDEVDGNVKNTDDDTSKFNKESNDKEAIKIFTPNNYTVNSDDTNFCSENKTCTFVTPPIVKTEDDEMFKTDEFSKSFDINNSEKSIFYQDKFSSGNMSHVFPQNVDDFGENSEKKILEVIDDSCIAEPIEKDSKIFEINDEENKKWNTSEETNKKELQNTNYEQDDPEASKVDLQLISKIFEVPILESENVEREPKLDEIKKKNYKKDENKNSIEDSEIHLLNNSETVRDLCDADPKEKNFEICVIKDEEYKKEIDTLILNTEELDNDEIVVDCENDFETLITTKDELISNTTDILGIQKSDDTKEILDHLIESNNEFDIVDPKVNIEEENFKTVSNYEELFKITNEVEKTSYAAEKRNKEELQNTVELDEPKINEIFMFKNDNLQPISKKPDILQVPILESKYEEGEPNSDDIKKTFSKKDPYYQLFNSEEFQFNRVPKTYKIHKLVDIFEPKNIVVEEPKTYKIHKLVDIFEPKNIVVEEPVQYSKNINVKYEISSPENSPDLVNCHNLNNFKIIPENIYVQNLKEYKFLNRKLKHLGVTYKSLDKQQRFLKFILIQDFKNTIKSSKVYDLNQKPHLESQFQRENNNVKDEIFNRDGTPTTDLGLKENIFQRLKLGKSFDSELRSVKRIDEEKFNFIANKKEFKDPKMIGTKEGIVDSKIKLLNKENQTKKDFPVDLKFLPVDGLVKAKRKIFEKELTNKIIHFPRKISKAKPDETVKIFSPKERIASLPKKSGKSKNIENFSPSPMEVLNKNENISYEFETTEDVDSTNDNSKIKSAKAMIIKEKRKQRFQKAKNLFKSLENSSTETPISSSDEE